MANNRPSQITMSKFDPEKAQEIASILYDYSCIAAKRFYENHPAFVERRKDFMELGETNREATLSTLIEYAEEAFAEESA